MREDAAVGLELPVAVALDTEKYNAAVVPRAAGYRRTLLNLVLTTFVT
jgi:hypothetical protein